MTLSKDTRIKLEKFHRDKRAWRSFLTLIALFLITLPAEWVCNVRPLLLVVDGRPYFPVLFTYSETDFGGRLPSEPDYKSPLFWRLLEGAPPATKAVASTPAPDGGTGFSLGLEDFEDGGTDGAPPAAEPGFSLGLDDFEDGPPAAEQKFVLELEDFEEDGPLVEPAPQAMPGEKPTGPRDVWVLWPPVRYDYKYIPTHSETGRIVLAAPYKRLAPDGESHLASSLRDGHYLGTDDRGRDVLARLVYGFRISMIFGISLAVTGTLLGCLIGGTQGFFGGWIDLFGQRLTEIWGSMPRLYILIILSAFLTPSALLLFLILNLTAWMGIAAYIRAEFLKIRNLEFVKAARAMGVSNFSIMWRHILPNALTPVITFFPFEVTAGILALVSLDYLNLGVPSPAPSIGELLAQGKNNLQALWILLPTFALLTGALTLLTFVGEGIRNAFDPRRAA